MSKMSEYHADLEQIRRVMEDDCGEYPDPNSPEVKVGMTVSGLMSATKSLSDLIASKTTEPLVRLDTNDIELAYTRLGRALSQLRQRRIQIVESSNA